MNTLILCLLLTVFVPYQKPSTELSWLRDDYIQATKDYKASLNKLLAIYERNVTSAEAKLVTARKLLEDGLISKAQLEENERTVGTEKDKVAETRRQMTNADTQIAEVLVEMSDEKLAQEYKKAVTQRRKKTRAPCSNWRLNAFRKETKRTISFGYTVVCDK